MFFFRKKIISKDMKAINYKRKNLTGSFILPKEALESCNFSEHVKKSKVNAAFLIINE